MSKKFLVIVAIIGLLGLITLGLTQAPWLRGNPSPTSECSTQTVSGETWWQCLHSADYRLAEANHRQIKIQLGERVLLVEVVNTADSIQQGLSGRESLASQGMLFILPELRETEFWMKEMQFDLDMVWIRAGKVVAVTANVPAPDPATPLAQLPTYSPGQPVDMVLELEAGKASEWGILPGVELEFK